MQIKPLASQMPVELVVSDVGNLMLLHRGALKHNYSWVQYDEEFMNLQFILQDGEAQDLGMKIHAPFHPALRRTKELLLVQVDENNQPIDMRFLKFAKTVN